MGRQTKGHDADLVEMWVDQLEDRQERLTRFQTTFLETYGWDTTLEEL